MPNLAENYEFVASLPPSGHPWKIHAFDRGVVLVNPEHPARIVRPDGTIGIVQHHAIALQAIEIKQPCIAKNYVAICASKLLQNLGGKP